MDLPGVPDSITRQQLADLLAALGLDTSRVPRGATLTLGPQAVSITIYARNAQGKMYATPDGTGPAMHEISIPIVDD